MAGRRLIRLSQVPERLTREKLEDSDWVTFGVLVNKATPQSNRSVSSCAASTFELWVISVCRKRRTIYKYIQKYKIV